MKECSTCPFSGRKKIKSKGDGRNGIGLILPFPSKADSERNDIFIDSYSSLTIAFLHKAGIRIEETKVIPLCSCPSSGDKYEEGDAFFSCRYRFKEDIKGLKLLILLGQEVSDALGLEGKIEDIRGSVYFNDDNQILLPTYAPKNVMPCVLQRDDANVPAKIIWQADFEKAKELVEEDFKGLKEDFNLFPSYQEVETFINTAVIKKSLIAVDIETTGFDPDKGEVMCVGLADTKERGLCIPFIEQGGRRYFSTEEEKKVKKLLEFLFTYGNLAYQNALFDVVYLRRSGFLHPYTSVKQDTMLLSHRISPELPHKLDFIVSIYGRTPYWKSLMRNKVGSNITQDDKEFRTYNLRDCVVIHQVLPNMLKDLKEKGKAFEEAYFKESLPLISPIGKMKEYGINFDEKELKKFKKTVEEDLSKIEKEMRALTKVPSIFNFSSDEDLRYLLFSIEPNKFKKIETLDLYDGEKTEKPRKKGTKIYQELLSLKELKDKTKPLLDKCPTSRTTNGGKVPVNQEALLAVVIKIQSRLKQIESFKNQEKFKEEVSSLKKTQKFISLFSSYSETEKLLSTYTSFPVGKDGRIHSSFLIHGTNTGRLSSRDINFQNLPKKDLRVRKCFIASKDHVLISADYSNLEIVVLTYIVNDKIYEEVFSKNGNVHDINTKGLFGIDEKHPDWKKCRAAAKIFFFGGIAYGGGDKEIYTKILMEVPDITLSFDGYKKARERWFAEHKEYSLWHDRVQKIAREERVSELFSGWRRELLGRENDILKQSLNCPIQGGAGHIINQATIRIDRRLTEERLRAKLIGQIHDQLILDCPLGEMKEASKILVDEMQRDVVINGKSRSFKVDLEAGWSLGTLKKYDTFLKELK